MGKSRAASHVSVRVADARPVQAISVPPAAASIEEPDERVIGKAGSPVLAMTFGAGVFDATAQVGVTHALLVSRGRAPDVVTGISSGAVHAAALAEVLQARDPSEQTGDLTPRRQAAQVARLRSVLDAAEELAVEFRRQLIPDMFEIHQQTPLRAPELPIHSDQERKERNEAAGARLGLVRLFNGLLSIRIQIGDLTRGLLLYLNFKEAGIARSIFNFWSLVAFNLHRIAPLARRLTSATLFTASNEAEAKEMEPLHQAARVGFTKLKGSLLTSLTFVLLLWAWLTPIWILVLLVKWFVKMIAGGNYNTFTQQHPKVAVLIQYGPPVVAVVGFVLLIFLILAVFWIRNNRQIVLEALLERFEIKKDLGNSHFVKQYLIRLFNPDYYGPTDMSKVVASALGEQGPFRATRDHRRKIEEYAKADPPIHVAIIAADIGRGGEMVTVAPDQPIVDGLLAATAVSPLFGPIQIEIEDGAGSARRTWCIDALNIGNEPTFALIEVLRRKVNRDAKTATVYAFSTVPLSAAKLVPHAQSNPDYHNVIDAALRARTLQRFQNTTFERHLVELYTRLMKKDAAWEKVGGREFVGAKIISMEPEQALDLNQRLAQADSDKERRQLLREAVATGCRTALTSMLGPTIRRVAANQGTTRCVPCRDVIQSHRIVNGVELPVLPGSDVEHYCAPGLPEICNACVLRSEAADPAGEKAPRRVLPIPSASIDQETQWPRWGEGSETACASVAATAAAATSKGQAAATHARTPQASVGKSNGDGRNQIELPLPKAAEPTVNFLFSGGVFRGVFQVGVVNAASELDLRPAVIAGASVGSIMGAMVANVFTQGERDARRQQIARIAAAFLALDKIVLTDRFYNLGGRLLLRLAAAKFSPRDTDRVFRQFELPSSLASRQWRRVIAGFERLFYINPFDLAELARKIRRRSMREVTQQLRMHCQTMLERYGVGNELLGAEPLALLISKLVICGDNAETVPFNYFARHPRYPVTLLAMTTDLENGKLVVLGDEHRAGPTLLEGLLASSAFPAAFRPQVLRGGSSVSGSELLYADGGVMDNLPLDPLVRSLENKAKACDRSGFSRRPQWEGKPVPHLVLTASLEIDPPALAEQKLQETASSWMRLYTRANQLSYNSKIDKFKAAQDGFDLLYDRPQRDQNLDPAFEPLHLKVITIKPRWLCKTFGFHPVLGFSREQQAQSIAHGCASTFVHFAELQGKEQEGRWLRAWQSRQRPQSVPPDQFDDAAIDQIYQNPTRSPDARGLPAKPAGECWFRHGQLCPFSQQALEHVTLDRADDDSDGCKAEREKIVKQELQQIYVQCGLPQTHQCRG